MKIIFLASSLTIIYYMRFQQNVKQTYDKEQDGFRVEFILVPCLVLALLINQEFGVMEVRLCLLSLRKLLDTMDLITEQTASLVGTGLNYAHVFRQILALHTSLLLLLKLAVSAESQSAD